MKKTSSLLSISILVFAFTRMPVAAQCPGNVAGTRYQSLGRLQIAIPVRINQSGPYEFMVDTGSQLTIVDPVLAADLRLKPQGSIGILAVSTHVGAGLAVAETLEVASHVTANLPMAVSSLEQIRSENPRVRGILGENFLAHFDILIDYSRRTLCLDDGTRMREELVGERSPLEARGGKGANFPFTQPYLIAIHVAGCSSAKTVVELDSGASVPLVWNDGGHMRSWNGSGQVMLGKGVGSNAQRLKTLAPVDVKIGSSWLRQLVVVAPVGGSVDNRGQDGLLPTALFHSVFLSYAEHFAMLDPKWVRHS